jgi:hypothetical protein
MSLRKNTAENVAEIEKKKKPVVGRKREIEVDEAKDDREELLVETPDDIKLASEINAKRLEYKKYADKQKKINYIITGVICVVLIACFACMMIFTSTTWVLYVGIGVMGVVLLGTYLSSKVMRKNLLAEAEVYINFLYSETEKYIFKNYKTEDFVATPKGTLQDKFFTDAHFYTNLKGTRSRNFVHFKLENVEYDACDLAANTMIKGKLSPKFLGRFYSMKLPLDTKDKVTIFQLKGGKLSVPIDDIQDLKLVEGNDVYAIYSNDESYSNIFTDRLVKTLCSFGNKSPKIDVIFSVKNNLISLGIDYEDEFLNIPVDNEFTIKNTKVSIEDFTKVKKIVDILKENKKLTKVSKDETKDSKNVVENNTKVASK